MKKLLTIVTFSVLAHLAYASEEGPELLSAKVDTSNQAAIQRGAKMFFNYCSGCHSAKYLRYKQLEKVGLPEALIKKDLMFAGGKIGDQVTIAMPAKDAAAWFGAAPPDLTLEARLKENGPDWLFTYLKSFYADAKRPMGVNNTVFPNVGMPNVLWELQGLQKAVFREEGHGEAKEEVVDHLEQMEPGKLTPKEFDANVRDLVTFLTYIAEPIKLERQSLGIWVVLFLVVFTVLAYLMKKSFWEDVH